VDNNLIINGKIMQFEEMKKRALEIRERYRELEIKKYGKAWEGKELALGFVGDVGDLMKLIMVKEGVREVDEDINRKIAHELADCLWSVLVLADEYDVDLEESFVRTMDEIEARFK
jgi:NTP pyrophosphatase (non-canonical NTP hydrolase)